MCTSVLKRPLFKKALYCLPRYVSFLGPQLSAHLLKDDAILTVSYPHTIWSKKWFQLARFNVNDQKALCILLCIWRVHLGISFLASQTFGFHPGDLITAPACLLSSPIFNCKLPLQNGVWLEERWQAWWRGSIHFHCLREADTGRQPTVWTVSDAWDSLPL